MRPGGVYSLGLPGGKSAILESRQDGSFLLNGRRSTEHASAGEGRRSRRDDRGLGGWVGVVSSRFTAVWFSRSRRLCSSRRPWLLLELATCGQILRGPQNDPKDNFLLVHDVPGHGSMVCHKAGIVEPVTLAIYNLLAAEWSGKTEWVQDAVSRQSFALLMRLYSAASELGSGNTGQSGWARTTLKRTIKPALDNFPLLH